MRSCAAVTLVLMLLLFGIPWLAEAPEGGQAPSEPLAAEGQRADADIALTVWDGQELRQMTMAEYLPGVVRGEMPAAFSQQALDAQAVAERTFICYHMAGGRKDAHPEADVCTSPACCSAYVSQEDAAARWGDKAEEYETKVQQAVRDTDGQIILYDGSPILAAFHSSSAGVTANSGDVWVSTLPYLHSVESPEGEDTVPNYYSVKEIPAAEFQQTFLAAYPEASFAGGPETWITGGYGIAFINSIKWRASASAASRWRAPRSGACWACGRRASRRRPRRTGLYSTSPASAMGWA